MRKGATIGLLAIAGLIALLVWANSGIEGGGQIGEGSSRAGGEQASKWTEQQDGSGGAAGLSNSVSRDGPQDYLLRLRDGQGLPIEGDVRVVQKTAALVERIRVGQLRGSWVWEDCVIAFDRTEDGNLLIPNGLLDPAGEYCALAFSPGYSPQAVAIPQEVGQVTIAFQDVPSVSVVVQTVDGRPLPNSNCTIRHGPQIPESARGDWVAGVRLMGFSMTTVTDVRGLTTIPIAYPGAVNSIEVFPPSGFASSSIREVSPGDIVEVYCEGAFSLSGVVMDSVTRTPIGGAELMFMDNHGGALRSIASLRASDEGRFAIERLPSGPFLSINVEAPGYASLTLDSFANLEGADKRRDFFLDRVGNLKVKLLSAWESPIRSLPLDIWERRFGWTNLRAMSDEAGVASLDEGLAVGHEYGITLHLSPELWVYLPDSFSTETKEIVVPGLAKIESVSLPPNLEAEGGELSWSPLSPDHRGVATWPVGETSPFLPAGSGMIGWTGPTGGTVKQLAILEEKPDNRIHLGEVESFIRFHWTGPQAATLTLLDGQDQYVVENQAIPPGDHEIPCWVGRFELILTTHEGQRTIDPVLAPPGGVNLGLLAGVDTASVNGVVLGPDRRPLPDIYVDLLGPDGSFAHTAVSMADGSFHITGVPAGEFILAASGDSAYGPDLLETRRALFIKPGESIGPIELVLPISQEGLVGQVRPIPPAKTAAWMVHGDEMVKDEVEFDGSFHLMVPPRDTTVGISRLRTGQVLIASTAVPAGARQVALTFPTGEHRLHLLKPSGEPLIDVNIQAFLDGRVLPYQAMPDAAGSLALQVDADRDIVLQFRLPDGRVEIHPIADLLGRSTLTLPSSEARHPLQVLDPDGEPLPLAVAMRFGVGDRFQADHEGKLLVGDTDDAHPYAIEAPGFLGRWWWPGDGEEITLERLIAGTTLTVPGRLKERAVATLVITLQDLGERATYPDARMLRVPAGGGTLRLPDLPAGIHRFDLLDAEGAVIQATELMVAPGRALQWPESRD